MSESPKTSTMANIPLSIPHIAGNEWKYIKECLDTGWVSSVGSYVNRFEEDMARYVNAPHAVAVVNGTAALHASLILSGVEAGDEVIVPTLTFIAPINAVRYLHANPVFMDCDDCLNIDPEKTVEFCESECEFDGEYLINRKTKSKIKAIIIVHVMGHPVNMEPLLELSKKYNLKLIEDAAESIGSSYVSGGLQGKQTGAVGDFGCFSFNGNKIITSGGGGMIVTADEEIAERARYFTTQARDDDELFLHHNVGYNQRLTNLQAAMGCAQLEQLDSYLQLKRDHLASYELMLEDVKGLQVLREPEYSRSNYWLYTLKVDESAFGCNALELTRALNQEGVQARPVWSLNHLQRPYQKNQSYKIEKAVTLQSQCLNIPSSVNLETEQIKYVSEVIRKVAS